LIIHPVAADRSGLPWEPEAAAERVRFIPDLLHNIVERCSEPLTVVRDPTRRVRSNCRTSAILLVAMLRHQGIPARKRTGFAAYIDFIHEIAECWDAAGKRWVLVDPDVPASTQSAWIAAHGGRVNGDTYGSFDLRESDAFVLGGEAWRRSRSGEADPRGFRGAGKGEGMAGVRQALLQDLDGLNKVELTSHDWWGGALDDKRHEDLTPTDLDGLDEAAALTLDVDARFSEMRRFYAANPHGRTVVTRLRRFSRLSTRQARTTPAA
jgi:hypothetical protein